MFFALTHVRANELRPGDVIVAHRTPDLVVFDYVQSLRIVADTVHLESTSYCVFANDENDPQVWEALAYSLRCQEWATIVPVKRYGDLLVSIVAAWMCGRWQAQNHRDYPMLHAGYSMHYVRTLATHGPLYAYAWSIGWQS